jgi:hypothetical protein
MRDFFLAVLEEMGDEVMFENVGSCAQWIMDDSIVLDTASKQRHS